MHCASPNQAGRNELPFLGGMTDRRTGVFCDNIYKFDAATMVYEVPLHGEVEQLGTAGRQAMTTMALMFLLMSVLWHHLSPRKYPSLRVCLEPRGNLPPRVLSRSQALALASHLVQWERNYRPELACGHIS